MNPWINYHHLYYFKTIVEEQSVTKAAQKLRLGQSTLSTQLKQFEDSIGTSLFERKNKRLILSEQGRVAFEYAQQIFKMGSEMYEVLQDRARPARVHLQIGALDSIPKTLISSLVQSALKIEPCHVTIVEGGPDQMLRELQAHKIDLFVTNFLPHGVGARGLSHKSILKKSVGIYGSKKMKHLKQNFPKSLNDQPMIMPTYDSQLRYDIEHWLKLNDVRVDIVAETQDSSLKKLLAVSGIGLISATSSSVEAQLESEELIKLGEMQRISEEIFLISAQRKIQHPVASQLIKTF